MARHGIKGVMGGGAGPGGADPDVVRAYQAAQAEVGKETELGENLIVGLDIHLGKIRDAAIKEVQPYFEENIKMFGPLGFTPRLSREQVTALNNPRPEDFAAIPSTAEFIDNGHYQFGTPQYLIDEIGKLQDAFPGLETVTVQPVIPIPKTRMFEQLQWFAEEVMPEFVPG